MLFGYKKFKFCVLIGLSCVLNSALAAFGKPQSPTLDAHLSRPRPKVHGESHFVAGPIFSRFSLTLDEGYRTEAAGPFFYDQKKDSEKTWAIPPIFSFDADPAVESEEYDILYPALTYERFGTEYRWQLGQLFSFAGGESPQGFPVKRFTLFPIYFQQHSPDSNQNYTAVVPFYGHLKNRLFRDKIFFVMFPAYSETRKRDVVTENYFYPFFDVSHGNGMHGWQFWPFIGSAHKVVTTQTNGFGEIETVPGYDKSFVFWPIHFYQHTGIGSDDPAVFRAWLPFYTSLRSPKRDSTSVLWPFFSWINDRGKKYHEWEGPYPFVAVARGKGKTSTRVWPFFQRAHNDIMESDYYLWPVYRYDWLHVKALDYRRTHILLYLFSNVTEKNVDTGAQRHRMDLWPLFDYHRDFNGNNRLQILAPIEPILPNNRGVERNWSPLWSVWRSENNPNTGRSSQSLLWNLYRHDRSPRETDLSLLFGLFRYQSTPEGKWVRLFYIPVIKTKSTINQ